MAVLALLLLLGYLDRVHDPCAPEWDRSLYEWRYCDKPDAREVRS